MIPFSPSRLDVAAIVAGPIAAGAAIILDAADIPLPAMVLLGGLMSALCLIIERALTAVTAQAKVRWLWSGLVVALLLPTGSWAYHVWFDSGDRSSYVLYLEGDVTGVLRSAGKPGGKEELPGLVLPAGGSYDFQCIAEDPGGRLWLKAVAGNHWYPASVFSPVGDFELSDMPTCE